MKKTHIFALVFIAVAIAAVIGTVYEGETYASFTKAKENPGKKYHIIGELNTARPMEEKVQSKALYFTFYMFDDEKNESKVLYMGAKPQGFEKLDQIVLIGSYNGELFAASDLLMKCPSKYNADEFESTGTVSENTHKDIE
ncbi:MAG: cytochrome c maturation protein CcmE [Bacteroidota bacterium]